MQTRRGTVLGKRGYHESSSAKTQVVCEQLHTPESSPNPKRPRTSLTLDDDGSNKENIPPLKDSLNSAELTPSRRARALRRSATEDTTPIRLGIQRSVSTSSLPPSTPSTSILALSFATPPPTPPALLLPLHTRIRALLRSTCNNTQLQITGRESERDTILNFLKPFIDDTTTNHDQSSMFISGSPGTGKTALVTRIVRELTAEHSGDLRVISINCMALKSLEVLWERMADELEHDAFKKCSAGKKAKGREVVRALLRTSDFKCILILDELDHITPNEQSLSSIFTLTESLPSTLRLIGIANTHTLTAAASNPLLGSTNVHTVHFAPYTPRELQEILSYRLASLSNGDSSDIASELKRFLPNAAVMLLTKKVAALTGDVRCLFEVLRGAIDVAVGASTSRISNENPLNTPPPTITPQHILAAFKAYTPSSSNFKSNRASATSSSVASNNEILAKVRNLGLQARLVLLTIIIASKRLEAGLSLSQAISSPKKTRPSPIKRSVSMPNPITTSCAGIDTSSLNAFYNLILSRTENGIFETVSRSEFGDLIGVLEGSGLVSLSSSGGAGTPRAKKTFSRSTSFGAGVARNGVGSVGEVRLVDGIWGEEILRCLGAINTDVASSDPREEEIRAIWEREKSRSSKDMKAASRSNNLDADVFSGAFQR